MKFKEFLNDATLINEERDSDYNGFSAEGQLLSVSVYKARHNNMMQIKINGERSLSKIKSAEELKTEYQEKDWPVIEKIWKKMAEKKSSELEKLVNEFEHSLNKIVLDMEKELEKL